MEVVLGPPGRETPPVLTYVDKGLGASILRARIRLWDGGTASPVAAVKITRHNLYRPTSLIHETGHQVAHLLGWTDEFAQVLRPALLPHAPAEVVESWMGDVIRGCRRTSTLLCIAAMPRWPPCTTWSPPRSRRCCATCPAILYPNPRTSACC